MSRKTGRKPFWNTAGCVVSPFSGDEYPYVIPLNYGFVWNEDQETRCCISTALRVGTKIEHMERDNRVGILCAE